VTLPLALPALYALRWVLNRLYNPNKAIYQDERLRRGRERAVPPEAAGDLMMPEQSGGEG